MVQCEMCGTETPSPTTAKIEGAELEVCADCEDFGTSVGGDADGGTSTKYSTDTGGTTTGGSTSGSTGGSSAGGGASGGGGGGGRRRDMFDEMEEVVQDYDDRIRDAREAEGLSQEEFARQLNEKASLIRKLERGEVLPSDSMQRKLERALDIELSAGGDSEDADWEGGASPGETTLGDVVQRKD